MKPVAPSGPDELDLLLLNAASTTFAGNCQAGPICYVAVWPVVDPPRAVPEQRRSALCWNKQVLVVAELGRRARSFGDPQLLVFVFIR